MVFVSVKHDIKELKNLAEQLSEKHVAAVFVRSINKTLMLGRTVARNEVKSVYNIPQKNISGIDIAKAASSKPEGSIFAPVAKISMNTFSPKFQTSTSSITITRKGERKSKEFKRKKSNPAMGVSIEVIKGKRTVVPFAFMARYRDLKKVFARGNYGSNGQFEVRKKRVNKTGNDLPITALVSLSIYNAVVNDKVLQKVERKVDNEFARVTIHEIKYQLSKIKT